MKNLLKHVYVTTDALYQTLKESQDFDTDGMYFVTDDSQCQTIYKGHVKIGGSFIIVDSTPSLPEQGVIYFIKHFGEDRNAFIGHFDGQNWISMFLAADYITNTYVVSAGTQYERLATSERFNDKKSTSVGPGSHAEGLNTKAGTDHGDGRMTYASHAEGYATEALGVASHAEGYGCSVKENTMGAHAEGYATIAAGPYAHAEGYGADPRHQQIPSLRPYSGATGAAAHVEGGGYTQISQAPFFAAMPNNALGMGSHAEGILTVAEGEASHAEGYDTFAKGKGSHSEGLYNHTTYNSETDYTLHAVGIGTSDTDRKNAHEIMNNGDHYVYGVGGYDGTNASDEDVLTLQEVINTTVKEYNKYIVVGIWGQSNAVGYDESPVTAFDVPKYANRIKQVSAISGDIIPLTYCAENLQNMNTVIPKGYTNQYESTPKPDQGTKGVQLPLANLICDTIPDDYGVIVVPYAYGGQDINYFLNDERVNGFTNNIKKALDLNEANVLAGIVWCQGENDSSNETKANNYQSNFEQLINKVSTKLQAYSTRTSKGLIDSSIWYFYEFPKYFRDQAYGYGVLDAIKAVLGEENYVTVPENHPVNITRYTSGTKEAHYAGDYFRTYIAPEIFACMINNSAFFTNNKCISHKTLKDAINDAMLIDIPTEEMKIVNEGDYIRHGSDNLKIVDGSVRLTLNCGVFEFEGDSFELHVDNSSTNGIMFLVGKTATNRILELYIGNTSTFKPLFQKSSPTATVWSNGLNLKSGLSSTAGQITYDEINVWSKTPVNGSTIKLVKDSNNNSISVYKDGTLLGVLNLSNVSDELIATIGISALWTGGSNYVQLSGVKAHHLVQENIKDVVEELYTSNKEILETVTLTVKNVLDGIGLPFVPSLSADNIIRWYNIHIRPDQGTGWWYTDGSYAACHSEAIANDERFYWAFVGNFVDGFKIYNKKYPGALTLQGNSQRCTLTDNGTVFQLRPGHTGYPYPYFGLSGSYNGTSLSLNKQNNEVKSWTGFDVGSTITVFPCP